MDQDENTSPAPVEAPAQAETQPSAETQPVDSAPADAPAPADDPPRDEKGRFQKRIDDLTRGKGEAEREAQYWRAQALKDQPSQPAPQPPGAPAKPKSDDYTNYEDFVEALTDWKVGERQREDSAQQQQKQRATTWQQRETEFRKTAEDYVDVVGNSEVSLPHHVLEAIQESELGPQMAYHFAKNPEAAQELAGLSERQAMLKLGRIEASLTSASAPAPAQPQARTTNAPPPVKPVAQPGNSAVSSPEKMSMDEYIAHRKKQGAAWAR